MGAVTRPSCWRASEGLPVLSKHFFKQEPVIFPASVHLRDVLHGLQVCHLFISQLQQMTHQISDCGNTNPCDQAPDYSCCLQMSRKGINAAASVTCLVGFSHNKACLQWSVEVVFMQGNTGHTALTLSQQGMSLVAPIAMTAPCSTLHLLFTGRQD